MEVELKNTDIWPVNSARQFLHCIIYHMHVNEGGDYEGEDLQVSMENWAMKKRKEN